MNNSKIWLVVKPTVGIPMFLGAVAVGSFAVHVAVLSNTTWVSDFLSGNELGSSQTAAIEAPIQPASLHADAATVYSVPNARAGGDDEMVIVLPDGRMAKAVFTKPVAMASPSYTPPKSTD